MEGEHNKQGVQVLVGVAFIILLKVKLSALAALAGSGSLSSSLTALSVLLSRYSNELSTASLLLSSSLSLLQ